MRNPGGYLIIGSGDSGPPIEKDTITCAHCNHVVVTTGADPSAFGHCTCCDAYICGPCTAKPCRPVELWLEEEEKKDRLTRTLRGEKV